MSEMTHWRVTIKERNTPHPIESEHHGFLTREQVIEFYGLLEQDVEWYRIEDIGGEAPGRSSKKRQGGLKRDKGNP